MRKYTFRNNRGDVVSVTAKSETTARHLAMVKLHGPSSGIYGPYYRGHGLALIEGEQP